MKSLKLSLLTLKIKDLLRILIITFWSQYLLLREKKFKGYFTFFWRIRESETYVAYLNKCCLSLLEIKLFQMLETFPSSFKSTAKKSWVLFKLEINILVLILIYFAKLSSCRSKNALPQRFIKTLNKTWWFLFDLSSFSVFIFHKFMFAF